MKIMYSMKKFVTLIGTNWPRSWSVLHQWEEYDAQCEAGKPLPLYEKQLELCLPLNWEGLTTHSLLATVQKL